MEQLDLRDLDSLHTELMDMQRTVIMCTICIVAAFLIFLPPIIYLYVRKLERGVWKLNGKTDNLLEYYKNIPDEKCSDKKSIVSNAKYHVILSNHV